MIVGFQLGLLAKRLGRRGLMLDVRTPAKQFLVEQGWDPQYGARPLKRAIQRFVEDELAKQVLNGDFQQGQTVVVNRAPSAEGLTFSAAALN